MSSNRPSSRTTRPCLIVVVVAVVVVVVVVVVGIGIVFNTSYLRTNALHIDQVSQLIDKHRQRLQDGPYEHLRE